MGTRCPTRRVTSATTSWRPSGAPELYDKIWFHKTSTAVIDADRCVGCGACIAACPSKSIGIGADGLPTLVRMCTGCSACWDYCPMAGMRVEKLNEQDEANPIGEPIQTVSARAVERPEGAQDGGAVTTLLATLMERGVIDAVIQTQKLDAFVGTPVLATTPEQVRTGAGSVYHQSETLAILNEKAPAGRRADRVRRNAVPDQRAARDPAVPVGAPRDARDTRSRSRSGCSARGRSIRRS